MNKAIIVSKMIINKIQIAINKSNFENRIVIDDCINLAYLADLICICVIYSLQYHYLISNIQKQIFSFFFILILLYLYLFINILHLKKNNNEYNLNINILKEKIINKNHKS